MSISKLLPLFVVLGLATVANAKTPKPRKLPANEMAAKRAAATPAGLQIADRPDDLSLVDKEYVTSQKIDSSIRFVDRSLIDYTLIEKETEVVVVVEHPTSGASEAYQLELDRDRARSVLPKNCAKNDAGQCRWVRLLTEANNTVGYVRFVKPQKLVALGNLVAKVDQLSKDTDKDGIKDIDDKCVEVPAGLTPDPFMAGCPDKDTDKDGLTDHHGDNCPTEAGPRENHGCPLKDAPAAVATPVPATTEAPKAAAPKPANNGAKKNSLYIPVGLYTGSLLSGSSLRNAHGGVDVGVSLQTLLTLEQFNGWSLALTLDLGQNTSFLNRGTVASNFPFMVSFGGLYNLGQRVQIGPEAWFGIVRTNLPDQDSYFAHVCGGLGPRVQTSVGAVQFFVAAGIGGCRSAQPGYTPGANGQPSAEVGGQVHGGLQIRIPAKRW